MSNVTPPRSVLIIVTRRIGDVLLATPLMRSVKQAWPDAALDVLVFEGTEGVIEAIPDIRRIAFAPNQAPSAAEWPWVLVVLLDDMAAVQRYTEHPAHVDVVQRVLAPIRSGRVAVDFAVG